MSRDYSPHADPQRVEIIRILGEYAEAVRASPTEPNPLAFVDRLEATINYSPEGRSLRREALDGALRVATGRETDEMLVARANAFLAFLRPDRVAEQP